jgi:hypothetical protein
MSPGLGPQARFTNGEIDRAKGKEHQQEACEWQKSQGLISACRRVLKEYDAAQTKKSRKSRI